MAAVSCVTFQFVLKVLERTTTIPIEEMLNQIDLKNEDLAKHDGKIDSEKLSNVFRYCMQKSNKPTLALDLGQAASLSLFRITCLLYFQFWDKYLVKV